MRLRTKFVVAGVTVAMLAGGAAWAYLTFWPATKLELRARNVPAYGHEVMTTGSYVELAGQGNLSKVNAALKDMVLQDQRQSQNFFHLSILKCTTNCAHNEYRLTPKAGKLSASSRVVSVFVPRSFTYSNYSNAMGDTGWVSGTLLVSSAKPVELASLFTDPTQGMVAVAKAARSQLLAHYPCIAAGSSYGPKVLAGGLDPTLVVDEAKTPLGSRVKHYRAPNNYNNFGLAPDGLTLGFNKSQVGDPVCGEPVVTIGWSELKPFMNKTGLAIVKDLR